ncbi:hypothetical protein L6452_30615 [Arctium lappa]|uniref:Uncharacterized protein n=1 Tax=Arctium lappa TaxID=4217 RepID=A0ACB8ZHP2_ARCLA|nr:hypothetical protein L6452_30615 [Arctium lappa]
MALNGFAHALKVWILEMFPVCLQNFTKRSDRLIRGTSWDRDAVLNKSACIGIFNSVLNVGHGPLAELRPTHAEQQSSWFQRSVAFFESSAGRRPTKRSQRRDPDHDDNDEDDDDGVRYQAPPSSSHHGVPSLDPYQQKWEYMYSMDRHIRELEAFTVHLRHTHVSTSMTPTYTPPGHMHGYTHAASATPSFQQSFGMTSMTPTYTSPGYTQAVAGGFAPFSTPSSQQNFGMTSMTPTYTSPGYTQVVAGGFASFSTPSFQQNFGMPEADCYRPQMMESGLSFFSGLVEDFLGTSIPYSMGSGSGVDTTQARLRTPLGDDFIVDHFEEDDIPINAAKRVTLERARRVVNAGPTFCSPYIQQPSTTPVPPKKTKARVKAKGKGKVGGDTTMTSAGQSMLLTAAQIMDKCLNNQLPHRFCPFYGDFQMDASFFMKLLGVGGSGDFDDLHIDAWVRMFQESRSTQARCVVMDNNFFEWLTLPGQGYRSVYETCNGLGHKNNPDWKGLERVYIPICIVDKQ